MMWIPESEQEILAAIEAGDLIETATFDAKATLPAKGKSKDLAVDVVTMTNDGGVLHHSFFAYRFVTRIRTGTRWSTCDEINKVCGRTAYSCLKEPSYEAQFA